jgi:NDP-sugar pyrophosphorylase family protein
MIESGVNIRALETQETWLNVVYPWDILHLNDAILRHFPAKSSGVIEKNVTMNGAVSVGKDTIIRSNSYLMGPLVIGEGCDIGPNVCLFPATSIADNVVIGAGSVVSNSVIGDDVSIGPGSIIQDSVIDRNAVLGARFTAASGEAEVKVDGEHHLVALGAMLGEGCTIGPGVTAQPGTVVGNYSQVRAQKLISGRLPDGGVFF